jgi:hypothetical protein
MVGEMQYHNCQGTTIPSQPLRMSDNTTEPVYDWPGMITDVTMYSDFKKLFKRDTLAKFRSRFEEKILEIEKLTPEEDGSPGFGIDAIMDIFDDVSDEFHDDNSL